MVGAGAQVQRYREWSHEKGQSCIEERLRSLIQGQFLRAIKEAGQQDGRRKQLFFISLGTTGNPIYHLAYVETENQANKEGLNLNRDILSSQQLINQLVYIKNQLAPRTHRIVNQCLLDCTCLRYCQNENIRLSSD